MMDTDIGKLIGRNISTTSTKARHHPGWKTNIKEQVIT